MSISISHLCSNSLLKQRQNKNKNKQIEKWTAKENRERLLGCWGIMSCAYIKIRCLRPTNPFQSAARRNHVGTTNKIDLKERKENIVSIANNFLINGWNNGSTILFAPPRAHTHTQTHHRVSQAMFGAGCRLTEYVGTVLSHLPLKSFIVFYFAFQRELIYECDSKRTFCAAFLPRYQRDGRGREDGEHGKGLGKRFIGWIKANRSNCCI